MYKTVRKGDASLQYTILPQTDQFSSSGFPQTSDKSSSRNIKYIIGTLMILIILSCVAAPFFINQSDQRLFARTMLAIGRVGHNTIARNSSRSQEKDIANKSKNRLPVTTTVSSTEAYRKQDTEDEMTTLSEASNVDEQESQEFTTTGIKFLDESYAIKVSTSKINAVIRVFALISNRITIETITVFFNFKMIEIPFP